MKIRGRAPEPAPGRSLEAARQAREVSVFTAYLARRRIARRIYGGTLIAFFGAAFFCVATGTYGDLPHFVVASGLVILGLAMACEWYLHRSRCPRCGHRFAGNSFILQSVALLTAKYRSCQSCGLSEEDLSDEQVIHGS